MENADITTLIVGLIASILKGIKKRFKLRGLIIAGISGATLAYGTLGALEFFMEGVDIRTAILSAWIVGWVANEITEVLDEIVKDLYEVILAWVKTKFKK